ncbi:MAG: hypothetical protein JWP06_224 [Candidatus Saccharibacteria bacterium]|nr:hypothetical protein [Candidatus Saccharibacteria bacterium]
MYGRRSLLHAICISCYDLKVMVSAEHESLLPRVVESDLLNYVFEDVADPTHNDRWQAFAKSNAVLAREVLLRVHIVSGANPDLQKKIIDEITYVYNALAAAALRLSTQEHTPVNVGDDV